MRSSAGVLVVLLLAASRAGATPAERFGLGARSASLASANAVDNDDYTAVYQNPAELVRGSGTLVGFGYQSLDYSLEVEGAELEPSSVHLLEGGFLARGHLFKLPAAVGVAFALPDGNLSSIESLSTDRPAWLLDELSNDVAFVGIGAALELTDGLVFGATLGNLARVRGSFSVNGTLQQSFLGNAPQSSALTHSVDAELGSVRYGTYALVLEPWRFLRVGAVYRERALIAQRIRGTLEGTLDYDGVLRVPVRYEFESNSIAAFLPEQLTLALRWEPERALAIDFALALQDLSDLPSPEARTGSRARVELPPGLDLELPPDRVAPPENSAGLKNRLVPRLAAERWFELDSKTRVAGRAGLFYEASTLPKASPWLDADRLGLSFGLGLAWKVGPVQLSLDSSVLHVRYLESGSATGTGLSVAGTFR